jgi:hypothetical protein
MKERQVRELNRFRRVWKCANDHLSEEPRFDALRAQLATCVARVEALRGEQAAATGLLPRDAAEIRPLRVALREHHMIPIARAGRRLMEFAPGAQRAYRVPKKRASLEALLAGADRLAVYVQKHARPFLRSGFEKDFVEKLRAATAALRERTSNTGEGRRLRTAATAALTRELPKGHKIIAIMDALLSERLRADAVFARLWRRESRMEGRIGRPKKRRGRTPAPPVTDGASAPATG